MQVKRHDTSYVHPVLHAIKTNKCYIVLLVSEEKCVTGSVVTNLC
jgi:hypothetical protein